MGSSDDTPHSGTIERHSGDHVREALNRYYFTKREAYGVVYGQDVLLVATIRGKTPTLIVNAGGEFDDSHEEHVYVGGETYRRTFDNAHNLDSEFKRWVSEYELEELD